VTIGLRDFVPELGREPLLFRETFRTRAATLANGASLVGTGTTFGGDGVTFNGNGNLSYAVSGPQILRSTMTFKIEFTLGFAPDEGVTRYFFDYRDAGGTSQFGLYRSAANALACVTNGVANISSAYAVWSAALVAGKNVLVISITSGADSAWLNGVLIASSGGAWTLTRPTILAIGSRYANDSRFIGTIHNLEIYGSVSDVKDEPLLRNGNLVQGIDFSQALAYLPGRSYYRRSADNLYVTDVGGKGTVSQALMGSDGSTVAQFPGIIRPNGFSSDGGDQINLGDADQFSFTNGVNDLPFSLSCLTSQVAGAVAFLMGKATAANNGEYILALFLTAGTVRVYFLQVDETAVATIGRYGTLGVSDFLRSRAIIVTSDGTGITGMRIYVGGVRVDTTNATTGVYARMRNTDKTLRIAGGNAGYTALNGNMVLPAVWDKELSPLQVKALTARYLWEARRN
jgi:hypothetical protein